MTDELTGLFNRRYFKDRLDREMRFAERSGFLYLVDEIRQRAKKIEHWLLS